MVSCSTSSPGYWKKFSLIEQAATGKLAPAKLLEFFEQNGRDLPWRDPAAGAWAVLVSEVMLQQTPVVRVLPVYLDWMTRWPDPAALAADAPGDAVRYWGRLGYPRRALRLHACATAITNDHAGAVPSDVEVLLTLPGIGDYTARAVAAFAFGQAVPVVDTNVRRVLNRVVRGNTDAGPATAADRVLMTSLLPEPNAATFSAAVMELGAIVCTAQSPDCPRCPVHTDCRWLAAGRPESLVRNKSQSWQGTDRQVRGRILGLLRDAPGSLTVEYLQTAWPEIDQWQRCLDSLLADGLISAEPSGRIRLPL